MSASDAPWSLGEARDACRAASMAQEKAEREVKRAYRDAAVAEEQYRMELATEIIRQHDAGVAWSTASDVARGQPKVATLRKKRDIALGVVEAMQQAAWRRVADRKDAQRFADWSQRRELAEAAFAGNEPEGPVFGRRRA